MFLAKKSPGTIAHHEWAKAGDVVDVPDELAAELLALAPDEFTAAAKRRTGRHGVPQERIISEAPTLDDGEL